MSASGGSSGRSPERRALKICRSVNRPRPVALSGVRLRGRVVKHGLPSGCATEQAPIWNSCTGLITPASQPFAPGSLPPPWHPPQSWLITSCRPSSTCSLDPAATCVSAPLVAAGFTPVQAASMRMGIIHPTFRDDLLHIRIAFPSDLVDLENPHHAVILMVEDVAVEHPLARVRVEVNDKSHGLVFRHIHRVLPVPVTHRHAIPVEQLKPETMQMEWMIHSH